MYAVRQFENVHNADAHAMSTGPQLIRQVGVPIDGFVAGVGTGGTLMGVARALRAAGHDTILAQALPVATFTPDGRPEVVGGVPGVVEGHGAGLLGPRKPWGSRSRCGSRTLRRSLPHASFAARGAGRRTLSRRAQHRRSPAPGRAPRRRLTTSATILPDRMERYFSTALFDDVAAEL